MCAYPFVYLFKEPTPLKVPILSKFLTSKETNSEQFPFNHGKPENYTSLETVLLGSRGLYAQGFLCTMPALLRYYLSQY